MKMTTEQREAIISAVIRAHALCGNMGEALDTAAADVGLDVVTAKEAGDIMVAAHGRIYS